MNQHSLLENTKSILFVGNHFSFPRNYKGAGEVIATHLTKYGWSVLLTSKKVNKLIRLFDMLWTILQKRNKYQIAIVDVFSGLASIWAYASCWLLNKLHKPYVLTLRGGDLPDFSQKHIRMIEKLFSNAGGVTSPSSYLADRFSGFHNDIRVIPNGIDISSYPYKLRESPDEKLVWLRAFHNIYNPALAPQVVSLLKKEGFDIHLTMIGPDKGDGSLKATLDKVEQLDLNNSIRIVKGVPKTQVPLELAKGDIFINTTNYDNTPVSVIEAMACGLCVVSTNVGGIPWLIEEGVDGLLVPPDDPESMAQAIIRLFSEPGLAGKLSKNALKKTRSFDWSVIIPLWDEVLSSLMTN
jgi:glycosyltransferase involved in cell wall biosynthesis